MAGVLVPSKREATPAPLTPRAKRPRLLGRQESDPKEPLPIAPIEGKENEKPRKILGYPLIGREEECRVLDDFLERLNSGSRNGRCLYVSGGPGTGKTCSVRASVDNFRRSRTDTQVLEVNCMDLKGANRSVPGVLSRLMEKMGTSLSHRQSTQSMANVTASQLAHLGARVVIVVDEVDQLVSRDKGKVAANSLSLETLFSLPRLPGAPSVVIVAIANAVDLLERTTALSATTGCNSLLFEPYRHETLKNIVVSRVKAAKGGEDALKELGPIKVELRVRQVAKECGDCRQVMSLIEEALLEAKSINGGRQHNILGDASSSLGRSSSSGPGQAKNKMLSQSNRHDPLQAIPHLPNEQKILLSVLASSKQEANKVSSIRVRYQELCRALKQSDNLGSIGQINNALEALEQRGLLELRGPNRGKARGKLQQSGSATNTTVELSVSCKELRKRVVKAMPLLERYMD